MPQIYDIPIRLIKPTTFLLDW